MIGLSVLMAFLWLVAATGKASGAGGSIKAENDACLACHGDKEVARKQLIYVDRASFSKSIHGKLKCVDCHSDVPHTQPVSEKILHAKTLALVNCTSCHYRGNPEGAPNFTPMQQYKTSVHGRASEKGDKDVATCSDCHGKHNIRAASDPDSTIYRANIPRTCAVCHDNMQMVLKHNIHVEQPYAEYQQSAHGKALFKDGLVSMAAVCTDCHGVHDIQGNGEADLKPHQPATCGKCHLNEYLAYSQSIHGKAYKMGISDSPVCADCHGEHKIAAPWNPESSVSAFHVTYTCARCHDDVTKMSKYNILTNKVSTFTKSDHGMGKDIGIVSVATCVSCHGYHDILPSNDPESSIYVSNMKTTCGKPHCHPNARPEIFQAHIHIERANGNFENLRRIRAAALWSLGALVSLGVVAGFIMFAARYRRSSGRSVTR
jgi:DnaJ-class molecular chaperone